MKFRDEFEARLGDVQGLPMAELPVIYPGQYTGFDLSIFYPGGLIP